MLQCGVYECGAFPDIVRGIVAVVVEVAQVIVIPAYQEVVFGLEAVRGSMDLDLCEGVQRFFKQAGGQEAEAELYPGIDDAGRVAQLKGDRLESARVGKGGIIIKNFISLIELAVADEKAGKIVFLALGEGGFELVYGF